MPGAAARITRWRSATIAIRRRGSSANTSPRESTASITRWRSRPDGSLNRCGSPRATPRVTEKACRKCHAEIVQAIESHRAVGAAVLHSLPFDGRTSRMSDSERSSRCRHLKAVADG